MKNKEIEELLYETKDLILYYAKDDEDYKNSVALFNVGKIESLLSYIEQLENKCKSLLENKNETLRYISNYLALDQRYKWNDNADKKLKLVKNILNGREKTNTNISYEDLLRQNEQLENNRDKAIEVIEKELKYPPKYLTGYSAIQVLNTLKGDSDE